QDCRGGGRVPVSEHPRRPQGRPPVGAGGDTGPPPPAGHPKAGRLARIWGRPLLGGRGVVVVAHGRSDSLAIRSSILVATDAVAQKITESIAGAAGSTSVPSPLT